MKINLQVEPTGKATAHLFLSTLVALSSGACTDKGPACSPDDAD
jgi:hypothetical protein